MIPRVFLTGPRRTGKTTMLHRALNRYGVDAGGFIVKRRVRWCPESRSHQVESFDLCDLITGLHSTVIRRGRGGGWAVDADGFRVAGVSSLLRAIRSGRAIIMDELGVFERGIPEFTLAVEQALRSGLPVLGVLKAEASDFRALILETCGPQAIVRVDRAGAARTAVWLDCLVADLAGRHV